MRLFLEKKIVEHNNGLFQTNLLFRKYSCQFSYFHFKHPKLISADYLLILFTRLALFEIEFYAKICMLIQSIISNCYSINKHGNFACICLYVECVACCVTVFAVRWTSVINRQRPGRTFHSEHNIYAFPVRCTDE